MKRLEILHVVLTVIGELRADVLMNAKLINVENELGDNLVGTGEDLLNDCVVLAAEGNDGFENVFAADVACLKTTKFMIKFTEIPLQLTAWLCSM